MKDDSKEIRYCLECGAELQGRKGKKFCNLVCKNRYNNRKSQTIRKYRSDIMSRLSRNYEILESLLMENMSCAGMDELHKLGFDDECFTGRKRGFRGNDRRSCFDISYNSSSRRIFNIERKDLTKV